MKPELIELIKNTEDFEKSLKILSDNFTGKIVFSSSFGIEDQVITDAVFTQNLNNIEVFTLDTGRLFQETYEVWDRTLLKYRKKIKTYYPKADELDDFITEKGINPFYESPELRKQCCHLRKVVPLQQALQGADVWIAGLRAEQSDNRHSLDIIQWDDNYKLYKFNPLLHWTTEQVIEYLKNKNVPYNKLYDQGFVSIGCAPCTRAIKPGEDFRAGRWWWEDQSKKECGLHK